MAVFSRTTRLIVVALLAVAPSANAANLAGSTPGQFEVDANGAATYTIPIQVPPGVNGVEPKLAITYSSAQGNGLAGVGASLSGLSSISRCGGDIATDGARTGISFNDARFCLDGARLIDVGGVDGQYREYRTQIESFARVRGYSTTALDTAKATFKPDYFKVWTKSGEVREYGNTLDSKYLSKNSTWLTWGVNKISDRQDNYITVSYTSNTEFYPASIKYGSTNTSDQNSAEAALREVVLGVDTLSRTDKMVRYVAGVKSEVNQRLKTITTKYAGATVRIYTIGYDAESSGGSRSQITSVQECDASNNCYTKPIQFAWKNVGTLSFASKSVGPSLVAGTEWGKNNLLADVNNDGFADLIEPNASTPTTVQVYLGNGDGTFSSTAKITTGVLTAATTTGEGVNQWNEVADMNGDGFADIVQVFPSTGAIRIHLGKGDGTFTVATTDLAGVTANTSSKPSFRFANQVIDMNGDGKMDFLVVSSASTTSTSFSIFYGNPVATGYSVTAGAAPGISLAAYTAGNGFRESNQFADINGDGLVDLMLVTASDVQVSIASSSNLAQGLAQNVFGTAVSSPGILPKRAWLKSTYGSYVSFVSQLVDVNGDGVLDLVYTKPVGGATYFPNSSFTFFTDRNGRYVEYGKKGTYFGTLYGPIYSCNDAISLLKWNTCFSYTFSPKLDNYTTDLYVNLGRGDGTFSGELLAASGILSTLGVNADPAGKYPFTDDYVSSSGTIISSQKTTIMSVYSVQNATWSDTKNGDTGLTGCEFNGSTGACFADSNVTHNLKGISHANQFADLDGDGILDVVSVNSAGAVSVAYGSGTGTFGTTKPVSGITVANAAAGFRASSGIYDIDGNGSADFLLANSASTSATSAISTLGKKGLVDSFSDGNGLIVHPDYAPLTDSSVLWRTTYADSYPIRRIVAPMYVVRYVSQTDAYTAPNNYAGGTFLYDTQYRYQDLRIDYTRGSLGFSQVAKSNLDIGPSSATGYTQFNLTTHTVYIQRFPYVGKSNFEVVTHDPLIRASGVLVDAFNSKRRLQQTSTQWDVSTANGVSFVFPVQRIDNVNEPNDTVDTYVLATTTTTNYKDGTDSDAAAFDQYGNPDVVEVLTSGSSNDKVTTTFTNSYVSNADFLGQLSQQTVAANYVTTEGASRTRTVSKTFYSANDSASGAANGLVDTETVEPTDTLKRAVKHTYFADGRPKSIAATGWDGSYDSNGNSTGAADKTRTQSYVYSNLGTRNWQVAESTVVNSKTLTTAVQTDGYYGAPSRVTEPDGVYTSTGYDQLGRPASQQLFSADAVAVGQNSALTEYTATCPAGITCATGTKLVVTTTPPVGAGAKVVKQYDALNRELRSVSKDYNAANVTVDTQYDGAGRPAQVSNPYRSGSPVSTTFAYDNAGRLVTKSLPSGVVVNIVPDGVTTTTTRTSSDEAAQKTIVVNDGLGKVLSVTDAHLKTANYNYAPFGQLSFASFDGLAVQRSYDAFGNMISQTDPDMGTWQYRYNAFGELVWQKDAKSQITTFGFDSAGRMATRTEGAGTTSSVATSWTYDNTSKGLGLLDNVSRNSIVTTYGYDNFKRPQTVTTALNGTSFAVTTNYVAATGQVDTVAYPSSGPTIKYGYYGNGLVQTIKNNGTSAEIWKATSYDERNQPTGETWGALITGTRGYDSNTGLLKTIRTGTSDNVQKLDYGYYQSGNLQSRTNGTASLTERFSYDGLNRLQGVVPSSGSAIKYNYDNRGNITYKTGVSGFRYGEAGSGGGPHAVSSIKLTNVGYTQTTLTNTIADVIGTGTSGTNCQTQQGHPSESIDLLDVICVNKYLADASLGSVNYSYTYDANGNMLTGAGRTITPTLFNKPGTIAYNGGTTTFTYDANYNRVKKSVTVSGATTSYTTLGDFYEQVVGSTGTTEDRYYVHAAGRLVAQISKVGTTTTTRYAHADLLGSVDAITEISATTYTVVEAKGFDEFGQPRLSNWGKGNPTFSKTTLSYTGHEFDTDSGLIDMNARLYDPLIGRFISADSVISDVYNAQNLNRYSYVLNNPFGYTDPTGHEYIPSSGYSDVARFDDGAGSAAATYDRNGGVFTFADGSTVGANGAFTAGLPSTDKFAPNFVAQWANGVGQELANPSSGSLLAQTSLQDLKNAGSTTGTINPVSKYDPVVAAQSWWYDKSRVDKGMDIVGVAAAGPELLELAAMKAGLTAGRAFAKEIPASTPVGRTGSWTDTSQFTGNSIRGSRELNIAGAKAGAPPVNTPAMIGGRWYGGHALDRMQQRGYVPSVVEDAIANGTRTPSYGTASSFYSSDNNITVIVNDVSGKVVTVRGGK